MMNAMQFKGDAQPLLDLIDFKWLMAGRGWRINLTRLSSDTEYARMWARRGMDSGEELLARRGAALMEQLSQKAA